MSAHSSPDEAAEGAVQPQAARELSVARSNTAWSTPGHDPLRLVVIMATLCVTVFIAALDASIISTIVPTISKHFDSATGYVWIGSCYLLASAVSSPTLARFSDVWGRKPLLLISNATFLVGSVLAASSVSIGMLLAGRVVQGVGGGGIIVLAQIIISDSFSQRHRASYLALVEIVWAIALAIGPIIGGALSSRISWRWCFYINLPISAVAFVCVLLFLDIETPKPNFRRAIAINDWIGTFLIIAGTILLLFGLELGATYESWNTVSTVCLIVFGATTLALFVIWELKYSTNPLIPMDVFFQRSSSATLAVCFIHGMVLISGSYFLPLYFQAVLAATPLLSGVYLLPTAISTSAASIAAGVYIRAAGNYLWPILTGLVLITTGYGLFINFGENSSMAKLIAYQIIAALGVGPNFQAPLVALQAMVPPRHVASATGTLNFLRNLSTAISIVIGGVIFESLMDSKQASLRQTVGDHTAALFSGAKAAAMIPSISNLPEAKKVVIQGAYAGSLSSMWTFYTAASALGLGSAFLIKTFALNTAVEPGQTGLDAELNRIEMTRLERKGK